MVTIKEGETLIVRTDGSSTMKYVITVTALATGLDPVTTLVDRWGHSLLDHQEAQGSVAIADDTVVFTNDSSAIQRVLDRAYFRNDGTATSSVMLLLGTATGEREVYRALLKPGHTALINRRGKVNVIDQRGFSLSQSPGAWLSNPYTTLRSTGQLSTGGGSPNGRFMGYIGDYDSSLTQAVIRLNVVTYSAPTISTALLFLMKPLRTRYDELATPNAVGKFRAFGVQDIAASITAVGRYTFTLPLLDYYTPGEPVFAGLYLRNSAGTLALRVTGSWGDIGSGSLPLDPSFHNGIYATGSVDITAAALENSIQAPVLDTTTPAEMTDTNIIGGFLQ